MKTLRRLVLLALLGALGASVWLAAMLGRPYQGFGHKGVFVEVPRGASVRTIANLLERSGVVPSAFAFGLLGRWRRQPLQAGEYFFDRPRAATEIFNLLASGQVYVRQLTVPEGLTMFEIAQLVEREGLASRDSFLAAVRDTAPIRDLAPHARSLEGFLFPATYQFPRRASAEDVAAAMVRRFREVWNSLPQHGHPGLGPEGPSAPRGAERPGSRQQPQNLSVSEVLTLASLVERETSTPEERPVIAGIFYNRLRRGMPLECDPTVIYALELAGEYRGTLSRHDLHFRSPYNTYLHAGLPPGPIANPGRSSLRAALDPPRIEYLYFVSNGQGRHFFSKTLQEHNANVARSRRLATQLSSERSGAPNDAGKPTRTGSWR